jgi:hypothetical protein
LLLGGFQADGLDEIVECLNDGGISTIERGDLFFWDRSVCGKGLQNAGGQWSTDFFINLDLQFVALFDLLNPLKKCVRPFIEGSLFRILRATITQSSQLLLVHHLEPCRTEYRPYGLWVQAPEPLVY